jgi:hypothetical protein
MDTEIAQNHLTRLYWPTGQATEHRESGVGRAKNNENMQDAGVAASN